MKVNNYYSKDIIEPFALQTIGLSFDKKYLGYHSPDDEDNFDYIAQSNKCALEITTVIPENEMKAYIFEKEQAKGKKNVRSNEIVFARLNSDGRLISWHGGALNETKKNIYKAIKKKNNIAIKRLNQKPYDYVDLCLCIVEGGLFDLNSFKLCFDNFDEFVFRNIFFITCSCFVCYNKETGFKEFSRIISD